MNMNMLCELAIIVTKIFLILLASGRYSCSEAAMPMPTICPTTSCGSSCDSNRSYNPFINHSYEEQMKVSSDYYNDFGSQINSRTSDHLVLYLCSSRSSFNASFIWTSDAVFVPTSQVDHVREEDGSCCSTFIYINIAFGFILVPVVGILWIFWRQKQKKVLKLRRNLFVRNGGELLQTLQSSQKTLSIFTAEDLNKATHNYDENNVLRQEHHYLGITYRGILHDVMNQTVTIKFCHGFDRCNAEALISKLVALSQISHRNVVKLLGCCLETQVPLVVYEFFTAKTLSDYLIDDCLAPSLSWDIRLRIAADIAGALEHMHSDTSEPIIHGSLNSSSIYILLDHAYTHVKLHGFALTCSSHGCSCVQFYGGPSGYLDPDYCLFGRLTEKSDVYSFGFILAELLTGKDVMTTPVWLEGEENLAKCILGSSSSGGNLLGILDDRVERDDHNGLQLQLSEVAEISRSCLSSSSRDRPMMKEVAIALQCIIHN